MGRLFLILRIVGRDLRRRPVQALLLLIAITSATTAMTLGLSLNDVTKDPYQQTRAATIGPDLVMTYQQSPEATHTQSESLAKLNDFATRPGAAAHSGPWPATWTRMTANGLTAGAETIGRDVAPALVDQPKPTAGAWLGGDGDAVLEASFASALGLGPGDPITLGGRTFRVVGTAVTAAVPTFPDACNDGCEPNMSRQAESSTGTVWVTQADAKSLATAAYPLSYTMDVKLKDPATADPTMFAFGDELGHNGDWAISANDAADVALQDSLITRGPQQAMQIGAWMLGLLSAAGVTVLVGSRLAEQTRRVGLLKAVGGTPGTVAASFLAQYVFLSLVAAGFGLVFGWLLAPLLTSPGSGLLGNAPSPSLTGRTVSTVLAAALTIAIASSLIPSLRAVRKSTVSALVDSVRRPRRGALTIEMSRRLPVWLMLGLRLAARRPRRSLLSGVSVGVTVMTLVTAITARHTLASSFLGPEHLSNLKNPRIQRIDAVLVAVTAVLIALAVINAVIVTWATALDAQRALAVARAFGATPGQVTVGLAAAQTVPALLGGILGVPAGMGFALALAKGGHATVFPPAWQLALAALVTVSATAVLTAVPARIEARRPVAGVLQVESA